MEEHKRHKEENIANSVCAFVGFLCASMWASFVLFAARFL
jgi:hypothetical protein